MSLLDLLLNGLAVWRLSYMLVEEDGPFGAVEWLRAHSGRRVNDVEGLTGAVVSTVSWPRWNPLHCVWCTSVWIGAIWALAPIPSWLTLLLALSAVTCLVEVWHAWTYKP